MKTLIITVGTRQVGWRCQDGIIRCFGADGERGHPPHLDELYQEIGVERGSYQEGKQTYNWGVQDLGNRYYQWCLNELAGDFGAVELLMDHQIIDEQITQGLQHIILWGSNQPKNTPYRYRSADTLYLAQLMASKIRATWTEVRVDVFDPVVSVNDTEGIRKELDEFILKYVLECIPEGKGDAFKLLIQSKGAAPSIANSLEICAAGLVRQYQVFNVMPKEPVPLYTEGSRNVNRSREHQIIPIGEYFWPLERLRVISAWEQGYFHEAQIWLKAHQNRYGLLHQLAGHLALATNWQIDKFIQTTNPGIGSWLSCTSLSEVVNKQQIQEWQAQLQASQSNPSLQAWEACFLIYLLLRQQNYTDAFMRFAQTLERLLYIRCTKEKWIKSGARCNFYELINKWSQCEKQLAVAESEQFKGLFHEIRETRNEIVHKAESMTAIEIRSIWTKAGGQFVKVDQLNSETNTIYDLMIHALRRVCAVDWQVPEKRLLQSLYEWGLTQLESDTALFRN